MTTHHVAAQGNEISFADLLSFREQANQVIDYLRHMAASCEGDAREQALIRPGTMAPLLLRMNAWLESHRPKPPPTEEPIAGHLAIFVHQGMVEDVLLQPMRSTPRMSEVGRHAEHETLKAVLVDLDTKGGDPAGMRPVTIAGQVGEAYIRILPISQPGTPGKRFQDMPLALYEYARNQRS